MKMKLSYSQKLKLLPVAVLAAILLVYVVAVSQTVQLSKYCRINSTRNLSLTELRRQFDSLNIRMIQLNQLSGNNNLTSNSDPLLNFISLTLAQPGKLIEYLPTHEYRIQNHIVSTRVAVIEGDYRNLLVFLNKLEKNYPNGKVASVKFQSETALRTGRKRLLMTLYIQTIIDEKSTEKI